MAGGAQQAIPIKKNRHITAIPRRSKMSALQLRLGAVSAAFVMLAASSSACLAQKHYDSGATDTEIKIGNIMPYSGPPSA
jgi:hypothetical protein